MNRRLVRSLQRRKMFHALTGSSLYVLRRASGVSWRPLALSQARRTMSSNAPVKLGFVGLGNMGLPMCLNLAKSDKVILAFDTNSSALEKARQGGIQCAESLDDVGQSDCDVIFTMLPGDAAVDAVLPALMKNWPRIIVDCSIVSPSTSRHWHTQVDMEGGDGSEMLDAPVSGGVKGATDATLTFMVGAGHVEGPFETVRPLLELMGQRVVHCGGPGTGSATKLCNNLALAAQMIGICEALNLGEALGVDPVVLSDVMNTSTAKSWSTEICNPHPEAAANIKVTSGGAISPPASRDYEGGFSTRLMLKDLGLAVSAGEAEGIALPLGAASKELYRLADLRGHGDKDFGVMLQFLRGK